MIQVLEETKLWKLAESSRIDVQKFLEELKMPKKYDSCVRDVKKKISSGKIPKTYKKGKKRLKTNPYKICSKSR